MPKLGQLSPLQKAAIVGGYGTGRPLRPCAVCGSFFRLCVDHIVPRAQGGTNAPTNLQPLCMPCNGWKGGLRSDAELRAWYAANRDAVEHYRRERYGLDHRTRDIAYA